MVKDIDKKAARFIDWCLIRSKIEYPSVAINEEADEIAEKANQAEWFSNGEIRVLIYSMD